VNGRDLLLLDTSIVIHVCRGKATGHRIETAYGLRSRPERPLVSVVTVGECLAFAARRQWGSSNVAILHDLLREFVVVDINSREVLDCYAEMTAASASGGWNLGDNDRWIAATASATEALLLTTDQDFSRVDSPPLRCVVIPIGES
jgi:tRNA(fMet)-specific endonuclease VapC